MRGLILYLIGEAEGEYRRLGMFVTAHGDPMNVLGVPHRSGNEIPCEEYDLSTHQHTILAV